MYNALKGCKMKISIKTNISNEYQKEEIEVIINAIKKQRN